MYHNATELACIMRCKCCAHSFRDLGELVLVGSGLPLWADDQKFCSCPPRPVRAFLSGERGPLTQEEQQAEKQRWEMEYGPSSKGERRKEAERVKELFRIYKFKKYLGR